MTRQPGLSHLRVVISGDAYIGPGRADLLAGIAASGSISDAAKAMGMSYKRAWGLVQALNDGFGVPLVTTVRGGSGQGGASLTPLGQAVLERYRHMVDATSAAIADDLKALQNLIDMSGRK